MAKSIADELMERRAALITNAQEIARKGVTEGRDLSVEEQTSFDQMIAEADKLSQRASAIAEGEKSARDLEESFRSATGHSTREQGTEKTDGKFGEWARSARVGDGFDVTGARGTEARAIAAARGEGETRAMGMGGTDQASVYSTLWEYAVEASELLQAGVQIINTDHGNSIPMPRVTAHAATDDSTVAASGAITESDSTIGTVALDVAKYAFVTYVPSELIQDATFDVEGYIARNAGRQLGLRVAEVANAAAVAGFTTAGVTGAVSATPVITYDNLVDLFHSVIPPYRSTSAFVMSDPGAAAIRKLKNDNGDPLWQPALVAGNPDLILGKPVRIDPYTADPAVSAKSMFFGDWSALAVRVAGGVRFERSNEFKFANDQVAFRAIVRTGAAALDPNAVKYFVHGAAA